MEVIECDENNNKILGYSPELKKSSIKFKGKNNVLICEENVKLTNSHLIFNGSNSITYLSKAKGEYMIHATLYHNSVLFIDENLSTNGILRIILSEEKNLIIGKDCLFSFGIWIRLADPHLIYDCKSKKRINDSKSVYVGDHVWIGQDAMILKGTKIGSGSIIGAKSVISNKKINSNSIWAGNPIKKIKEDVFFDKIAVHYFRKNTKEKYEKYESNQWIYTSNNAQSGFEEIESFLSKSQDVDEKIEYLKLIKENNKHDRFYIPPEKKKKFKFLSSIF